jgi:hypothetical protein
MALFGFQAHEPVQSLFGALNHTNLLMEVEISQTFTGQGRHAVFLPSQWEHYLSFDAQPGLPLAGLLGGCRRPTRSASAGWAGTPAKPPPPRSLPSGQC